MKITRTLLLLLLGLPLLSAQAQSLDEEVDNALRGASARSATSLGSTDAPVIINKPAQVFYELGAVVDVRQASDTGIAVLAITPDGAADRLELKAGDTIAAINGTRFAGAANPASLLKSTMRESQGQLKIEVVRNGQPLTVAGASDVVGLPAYQLSIGAADADSCGYVTDQYGPPRHDGIFFAVITQIDGRSTPLQPKNRHRVEPGKHVLTVAERIPGRYLTSAQIRQTHLMKKREFRYYKQLVVDVKPNTSYRIGSRLLKEKLDAASIRANEYWEPMVWEENPSSCR